MPTTSSPREPALAGRDRTAFAAVRAEGEAVVRLVAAVLAAGILAAGLVIWRSLV